MCACAVCQHHYRDQCGSICTHQDCEGRTQPTFHNFLPKPQYLVLSTQYPEQIFETHSSRHCTDKNSVLGTRYSVLNHSHRKRVHHAFQVESQSQTILVTQHATAVRNLARRFIHQQRFRGGESANDFV